jgi:hypothetical protein
VAIPYPGSEHPLEPGTDATDLDRIIDEVVRLGLADGDLRKTGHGTSP